MFNRKFFKFKSPEAQQKFINSWEGQSKQQQSVADFIGSGVIRIESSTPAGAVRIVKRMVDDMAYYTDLPEPLIDAAELQLFFDEVEFPSLSGSDRVDYTIEQSIKLMCIGQRSEVLAVLKNLKHMSACAVIANIISTDAVSPEDKCWIVNAIYNEAHKENN